MVDTLAILENGHITKIVMYGRTRAENARYFNNYIYSPGYTLLDVLSRDTIYIKTPRPGLMQVQYMGSKIWLNKQNKNIFGTC